VSSIVKDVLESMQLENIDAVESADKYLYISEDGGVVKFKADIIPYMIKPILYSFSRLYRELIVCAPARSGKSKSLVEAVIAYRAWQLPSNILAVFPTQTGARKYSKTELDRMINATEFLRRLKTSRAQDLGIEQKNLKNGTQIYTDSATAEALAVRGYGLVIFTDYDRSSDDGTGSGDSEASKFSRGSARTKSDRSSGTCIAEGSPSRMPYKKQDNLGEHELPRCEGVAGLYNEGTRHWYYWQCPECGQWMKCHFGLMKWTKGQPESAHCECPHCEAKFTMKDRYDLNLNGDYFQEGEIDKSGNRTGKKPKPPQKMNRVSFHFSGVNSYWNDWVEMVAAFESGHQRYDKTGDDGELQVFWNTDEGIPFIPPERDSDLTIDKLKARHHEYLLPKGVAPSDTRCVIACVDVQGGKFARFVVNVFAVNDRMQWQPIDEFEITHNPDRVEAGEPQKVKPETYDEDWRVLIDRVMNKEYEIQGLADKTIIPAYVMCDSGGSADKDADTKGNTTFNAYEFHRYLVEIGLDYRFRLVKGNPRAFKGDNTDKFTRLTYPVSDNQEHDFAADGDVPLLQLNSNKLKRLVYSCLTKESDSDYRYFRRPVWADEAYFSGLLAEEMDDKGVWHFDGSGNEPFDLAAYLQACLWERGVTTINFDGDEPDWCRPLHLNVNVADKGSHSLYLEEEDDYYEYDSGGYIPDAF
ncbi:phage terminase large subunit family protein, partial [Vibrio hannami]